MVPGWDWLVREVNHENGPVGMPGAGGVVFVYQLDFASGMIALRSVRSIHWDLQMSDYNGQKPLSQEIRALSEQR
jgi:hypothetical protein